MVRTVLSLILAMSAMEAANWPQWRGPQGTGVSDETGLPVEWSRDQNIAWRVPLAGLGVSGPVVWGDRVFLTYQIGAGALRKGNHPSFVQSGDPAAVGELPLGGARPEGVDDRIYFVVAAFQAADGKLLWEHKVAAEGDLAEVHEKRNLATPSPVTDGERVYAWFSNGQLIVLDVAGKPVWSRHLGKEYKPFDLSWGHSSSPVLYKDKLLLLSYQSSSASFLAVDKRTGKEIWKTDQQKAAQSYSTPLVIETAKGPEAIVNSSERIEAFDPETGKSLWQYNLPHRFTVPMPVFHDGMIYINRGYRSSPFLAIRPGGRGDITSSHVVWNVGAGAPYVSSLIHHDGLLFYVTEQGIANCIEAKTGERVWQDRIGGVYSASPIAADGKVYLFGEAGETVVLKPGRTPQVLARNKLDGRIIASPAVSGGRIFVRTDRHLIAIQSK
jgi:outer membrane protein assembly factor BamB